MFTKHFFVTYSEADRTGKYEEFTSVIRAKNAWKAYDIANATCHRKADETKKRWVVQDMKRI